MIIIVECVCIFELKLHLFYTLYTSKIISMFISCISEAPGQLVIFQTVSATAVLLVWCAVGRHADPLEGSVRIQRLSPLQGSLAESHPGSLSGRNRPCVCIEHLWVLARMSHCVCCFSVFWTCKWICWTRAHRGIIPGGLWTALWGATWFQSLEPCSQKCPSLMSESS